MTDESKKDGAKSAGKSSRAAKGARKPAAKSAKASTAAGEKTEAKPAPTSADSRVTESETQPAYEAAPGQSEVYQGAPQGQAEAPPQSQGRQEGLQQEGQQQEPVVYSASDGLAGFLAQRNLSFGFTSYQSGRLYLVGRNPNGGIMVNERMFRQAMGLHADRQRLYLATLFQIFRMENVLGPDQRVNNTFDACYVPRTIQVTGHLHSHDIGICSDGAIVFVNTKFSCLAMPSVSHSFRPVWKPPFISKLAPEDRCHLNGLAMEDGQPAYVTAISRSDTIDGWRDRRDKGGVLIDVRSNRILVDDLSMPHSPRVRNGKVWLLNSGKGELGFVDPAEETPKFHPVAFCPGFARGLSFFGDYAFVGLSKPRYKRFEGLELDQRLAEKDTDPWCGIQVINLKSGDVAQWFRLDGPIGELYDVACIEGVQTPMSLGFHSEEIVNFITHEPLAQAG
jgi:uncharacterized protein (TIGR03032 family)